MGKHWVREQVRKDVVQESVDKGVRWVDHNRSQALAWTGGVAAAALVAVIAFTHVRSSHDGAWTRFSVAQGMAYSGQPDKALAEIKALQDEQGNTDAAGFGRILAGDIDYTRGSYKEALDQYAAVLERGKPASLQPIALSDTAISQEASGQFQQAAQTAQHFLDQYPDHFLAPQVHGCLARAQVAMGQLDAAKTTWQKISLQYPDTSWAAWAQARLQAASK